ncbi:MAG: hypothetical protein FD153_1987, partial [Rhodospirillaceae bacterium]
AELIRFQRLNVSPGTRTESAPHLSYELYTSRAAVVVTPPSPDLAMVDRIMAKSVDQIERVGQTIHGLRDFMSKGVLHHARRAAAADI